MTTESGDQPRYGPEQCPSGPSARPEPCDSCLWHRAANPRGCFDSYLVASGQAVKRPPFPPFGAPEEGDAVPDKPTRKRQSIEGSSVGPF